MPNSISNHFAITALQEGVTIQGSLRVAGTLSQNYNPNSGRCIPDWKTTVAKRPVIYPVIRKGAQYCNNAQINNGKWYYNDIEIQFDSTTGLSTNLVDGNGDAIFQLGTRVVNLGGSDYTLPALTIINNLASANNVDLDTIVYQGSVELNGKQVSFPPCGIDVKIAQMTTQGYLGLLSPESAIISHKGETVTITAELYNEAGEIPTTFYTKWYNAGTGVELSAGAHITIPVNGRSVTVDSEAVTDNLVLRCDFFTDSAKTNRVTTAFASIDDTQDPEYLYISLNGSNSDFSGQLSPGESCEVTMWVATMEDRTAINTEYTHFTVRLFDGQQNEIVETAPAVTVQNNKGKVTYTYDFIAQCGYKLNGIVTAS